MSATGSSGADRPRADRRVVGTGLVLLAVGMFQAGAAAGARQVALFVVGALLGVTLYHASFGFTAAWRRFLVAADGRGLRAQMLMLALAVLLFFPTLGAGQLFGLPVAGFVAPAGTSVAVGAFLFGVGMQLGGGCGSGTLYTVAGGSARMAVTLAFFVLGSVTATAHLPFWHGLPAPAPYSFIHSWGVLPALIAHLALFALIAAGTLRLERGPARSPAGAMPAWDILRGPWPLHAGAVALALLSFTTLLLAGRPWGITSAFALWGAKAFNAAGIGVADWPHWQPLRDAIEQSVWLDVTSVMDFGIVLGALLAAGLAGRFRPSWRLSRAELLTAIAGGLLLGYGARLAFGCNVGAFFSGVASGSLHGWLWLVCAFAGNWAGTRLRPACGLSRI